MSIMKDMLLLIKYGYKGTSQSYYKFLIRKGVNIKGKIVRFHSPWTIMIDIQKPWMIEVGNNVNITAYCKILTHGYEWSVLQGKYGKILGSAGKVKIGNNVFIGQNTTILKGTIIEDNVIIGANSLVCKKCEANSVYAGVPAKRICSIDEYLKKRDTSRLNEAAESIIEYYKKYGKYPEKKYLRDFCYLFENNYDNLEDELKYVFKLSGNEEKSIKVFKENKPMFKNYAEFIDYIKKNYN